LPSVRHLDADHVDVALPVGEEAVVKDDGAALDVAHVGADEALAEVCGAHRSPVL
jgi:hypothetical protein